MQYMTLFNITAARLAALYFEGLGITSEDLDEAVHDAKGREASDINNAGVSAQLMYLIGTRDLAASSAALAELATELCADARIASLRFD
jgi:hypothetical protein